MDIRMIPTRKTINMARFSASEKVEANRVWKKYFPNKIYSPETPEKSVMPIPKYPANFKGKRLKETKLFIASAKSFQKL